MDRATVGREMCTGGVHGVCWLDSGAMQFLCRPAGLEHGNGLTKSPNKSCPQAYSPFLPVPLPPKLERAPSSALLPTWK